MDYNKQNKKGKAVAFDFLGVIANHDGKPFVSEEHYTTYEPNPRVLETINILKKKGFKILIHSTVSTELMEKYCKNHKIPYDEINQNSDFDAGNAGKPVAFVYVDDRALCYRGQSGEDLANEIQNFKPYWK